MSKELAVIPEWRWTEKRRKALKLFVRGLFIKDIAASVHMSRMTIHTWVKAPEFQAEVFRLLEERGITGSMKQSYLTSKVTDELGNRYMKALQRFKRAQLHPKKSLRRLEMQGHLLEQMDGLSKQYERIRNQSRLDSGQATTVSKHTSMVVHGGTVDHKHAHEHALNFRDYMEKHRNEIVVNPTATPQQQLIDATVQVMQGTDFLEKVMEREMATAEKT